MRHATRAVAFAAAVSCLLASARAVGAPAPPLRAADLERGRLAARARVLLAEGPPRVAAGTVLVDIDSVSLDLDLDFDAQALRGRARLRLRSEAETLGRVVLDLDRALAVDSVRCDRGVAGFAHTGDSLAVDLVAPLAKGQPAVLTVWYGGVPNGGDGFGLVFDTHGRYTPDPADDGPLAASLSEPEAAHRWWPCKDRPDDKFVCDVAVTVPAGLIAVSNGTLRGSGEPAPGRTRWAWASRHPIAAYLVSIAVSDYVESGGPCVPVAGPPVALRHWAFPADAGRAEATFAPTCDMIGFLGGLLGPYPFADEKYGHAEFLWPGAMEHQTVASWGQLLMGAGTAAESIVLHELAHQWFGDSVTPRRWADVWLNEGFATYCEALWRERAAGRAGYLEFLAGRRSETDWAGESTVYDPFPIFPGWVIYDKGAWILHMLRERVGDAGFFALVAAWAGGGDRPYGTATTAEFVALASARAGEDLGPFFAPWLTTDEVPRLLLAWEPTAGAGGSGDAVRITLAQTQPTPFDMVYPLRIVAGADTLEVRAPLRERERSFTFDAPAPVTAVSLDPEGRLCWRAAAAPPAGDGIVAVYPNPSRGGSVSVALRLTSAAPVALAVFDARGRRVATRDAGTLAPLLAGNVVAWDGRDDDGRPLPSGTYWIRARAGARESVRRVTLAR